MHPSLSFFFFNDTATTEIYTLSLHDALPIFTFGDNVKVGIGLPNPVPGTPGETLVAWARKAEAAGFSSLATIDRIAYPSFESLVTLAAAAAVTERVGLGTNALLGPARTPGLLAKEAASEDQLPRG